MYGSTLGTRKELKNNPDFAGHDVGICAQTLESALKRWNLQVVGENSVMYTKCKATRRYSFEQIGGMSP